MPQLDEVTVYFIALRMKYATQRICRILQCLGRHNRIRPAHDRIVRTLQVSRHPVENAMRLARNMTAIVMLAVGVESRGWIDGGKVAEAAEAKKVSFFSGLSFAVRV